MVIVLTIAHLSCFMDHTVEHFLTIEPSCPLCWIGVACIVWMVMIVVEHESNKRKGIHG